MNRGEACHPSFLTGLSPRFVSYTTGRFAGGQRCLKGNASH
jgi:hypothetical protein